MNSSSMMSRAKALLEERRISQASFARSIDVSPQTLSAWMSGRNRPGVADVEKMCVALSVSPSWLITGTEDAIGSQSLVLPDYVSIPRFNVAASCGAGAEQANAAAIGLAQVNRQWVRRYCGGADPRSLNVIMVSGDSMQPTLDDGDFVIVDLNYSTLAADSMYAFVRDSAVYVKRLQRLGRSVRVISDNRAYPPYELSAEDMASGFRIIGRVVTTCVVRQN